MPAIARTRTTRIYVSQNSTVPTSSAHFRWASVRRNARHWEHIGALPSVIRTLLYRVCEPPQGRFINGEELPIIRMMGSSYSLRNSSICGRSLIRAVRADEGLSCVNLSAGHFCTRQGTSTQGISDFELIYGMATRETTLHYQFKGAKHTFRQEICSYRNDVFIRFLPMYRTKYSYSIVL